MMLRNPPTPGNYLITYRLTHKLTRFGPRSTCQPTLQTLAIFALAVN